MYSGVCVIEEQCFHDTGKHALISQQYGSVHRVAFSAPRHITLPCLTVMTKDNLPHHAHIIATCAIRTNPYDRLGASTHKVHGRRGSAKAPYADLPPRDITDADLQFLSDYTGERDLAALRQHVLTFGTPSRLRHVVCAQTTVRAYCGL